MKLARQPESLGLVQAGRRVEAVVQSLRIGQAEDSPHSGQAEEEPVAADTLQRTNRHQVDQHVGAEAANLPGQAQQFEGVARPHGVAHVAVDQARAAQHRRRCRSLGMHREVAQQHPLSLRESAFDQMKAGQRHDRVAQLPRRYINTFLTEAFGFNERLAASSRPPDREG